MKANRCARRLMALLTPHSQQHELASSTTAYISKLLAAFEQEQQGASISLVATPTPAPAPSPARQASAVSIRAGCLPHPARAGSLAPAGRRGLESGHRSHAGDFPGHREKTRQQSARQVRSLQSHASDYPGACPLPALTRFLPTPGLSARKPTLFLHF